MLSVDWVVRSVGCSSSSNCSSRMLIIVVCVFILEDFIYVLVFFF